MALSTSRVQTAQSKAANTSLQCAAFSVTSGDRIVVAYVADPTGASVSATDLNSNSYSLDGFKTQGSGTAGVFVAVLSAQASTTNAAQQVTVSYGSTTAKAFEVWVITGGTTVPGANYANGSSSTASTVTATRVDNGEVLVGATGVENPSLGTFTNVGTLATVSTRDSTTFGTTGSTAATNVSIGVTTFLSGSNQTSQTFASTVASGNWATALVRYATPFAFNATNTFDGSSQGTTITTGNSGGGSGLAFDAVNIGAACTLTYDNTHAAQGPFAAKVVYATGANHTSVAWTTSAGTQTTIYGRVYFWTASAQTFFVFGTDTGDRRVVCGIFGFTDQFIHVGVAGGDVVSANSYPLSQWNRADFRFVYSGGSTGSFDVRLFFSGAEATTPTETVSGSGLSNMGSSADAFVFGAAQDATVGSSTIWIDGINLNTTGFPGPSVIAARQLIVPPNQAVRRASVW